MFSSLAVLVALALCLLSWRDACHALTAKTSLRNVSAKLSPDAPAQWARLDVSVRTRATRLIGSGDARAFRFVVVAPPFAGSGVRLAATVSALNRPLVPAAFARLRFHEVRLRSFFLQTFFF